VANLEVFHSDKDLTRFEFIKQVVLIGGLTIIGAFFYHYRFGHRDDSILPAFLVTLVTLVGLLTWILRQRIYTQFILDLNNKLLTIEYMTLREDSRQIEIPFSRASAEFVKSPTKHDPGKRTLKIFDGETQVVEIDTGQDGFSMATLQRLAERLTVVVGDAKNSQL
jgi:hypothetical protein